MILSGRKKKIFEMRNICVMFYRNVMISFSRKGEREP